MRLAIGILGTLALSVSGTLALILTPPDPPAPRYRTRSHVRRIPR